MDKVVLGFAPTRRAIFSAPAAVEYRGLTAKRLTELGVDFVDIDDINEEGLLYDDEGMEKIYKSSNMPTWTACSFHIVISVPNMKSAVWQRSWMCRYSSGDRGTNVRMRTV